MRTPLFFLCILALLALQGCDTAISVLISNPAIGTEEQPKELLPGEQLGVYIHADVDLSTFKVTLQDPNTGDDACPYMLPVDITESFAPISAGTTVKALPTGRMSACGPFLMHAEAQFAEPPTASKVITSAEVWLKGYEVREVPPRGEDIKLAVGEVVDFGADFLKAAVGDFTVTATVSQAEIPIVMINNSLPSAEMTVPKDGNSVRFQLKGVTAGECSVWLSLPGGPGYGKKIIVE
ncbi:MAG: hypothetical protein IPL49_08740 [Saprospirales bacterium]|nr:hypothetical protein [Saprospirales bacterium]MBK8490957.1 hypothetical protein [Saprospirales bacterium]